MFNFPQTVASTIFEITPQIDIEATELQPRKAYEKDENGVNRKTDKDQLTENGLKIYPVQNVTIKQIDSNGKKTVLKGATLTINEPIDLKEGVHYTTVGDLQLNIYGRSDKGSTFVDLFHSMSAHSLIEKTKNHKGE